MVRPRQADVLKLAGADANSGYVTANGTDIGVAKTPDFIRSLVMRKALHASTLLALRMNGQPLPALHGFPLRLIVPGRDGTSRVKWLNDLSVDEKQDAGFFNESCLSISQACGDAGDSSPSGRSRSN